MSIEQGRESTFDADLGLDPALMHAVIQEMSNGDPPMAPLTGTPLAEPNPLYDAWYVRNPNGELAVTGPGRYATWRDTGAIAGLVLLSAGAMLAGDTAAAVLLMMASVVFSLIRSVTSPLKVKEP